MLMLPLWEKVLERNWFDTGILSARCTFFFFVFFALFFFLCRLILADPWCSSFSFYEEILFLHLPRVLNPARGLDLGKQRISLLGGGFFHWLLLFLLLPRGTHFSLSVNP